MNKGQEPSQPTDPELGTSPAGGEGNTPQNPTSPESGGLQLTDQQWEKVFEHPRFSSLLQRAKAAEKKAAEYDAAKKKEAEQKLKEEGKLKELVEQKDTEIGSLKGQLDALRKESAILTAVSKLGVVDPDAVVKLIDMSAIKVDSEGRPTNVEEIVSSLVEEKPYLKAGGTAQTPSNIGSSVNQASADGKPIFRISDLKQKLQDHQWYKDHKDEVEQAQREGRIVNDEAVPHA